MDQLIPATYWERPLLLLSERQNGNAALTTQHDDAGNRTNYLSKYPIDLTGYDFAVAEVRKSDLLVYLKAKRTTLVDGGLTFTITTDGVEKTIIADTDLKGRTNLSGLVALAQMSNTFSTTWVQSSGDVTLNASEIIQVGIAVGGFVEHCYRTYSEVMAKINNGMISSNDQIDKADWPKAS